jgi:galactokinase
MQVGVLFVKDRFRPVAHLIDHLSDISPKRLGIPLSDVYEMLLQVPVEMDWKSARRQLSRQARPRLDEIFEPLETTRGLPVREALLFGMTECRRSEMVSDCFASGDLEVVAELMQRSHASERHVPGGASAASDAALRDLVADLKSEVPARVLRAQLEYRTGRYGSSTPAIDAVVDAAQKLPGAVAAQLSGSGAGGCVMVLIHKGGFEKVARALRKGRKGLVIERLRPVAGSGAVRT